MPREYLPPSPTSTLFFRVVPCCCRLIDIERRAHWSFNLRRSVSITFANRASGERWTETGIVGQNMLQLAQNKAIGMRGESWDPNFGWIRLNVLLTVHSCAAAGVHGMNVHSHIIVPGE